MILLDKTHKKGLKFFFTLLITLLVILLLIDNSTTLLKLIFPMRYEEYVYKYSEKSNVDPYLVFAVIKAESGFHPGAVSKKNAKGLMQITEKTGSWGAQNLNLTQYNNESLLNPEINICIGCWYLGNLMKEFNNNLDLVVTAYNGGSGNVNEWLKDKSLSNTGNSLEKIPFKETERYVKKVRDYYFIYKRLYEKPS